MPRQADRRASDRAYPAPMATSTRAPVVLHSSLARLVLAASTPVLLLSLGIFGLTLRVWLPTLLLTALGAVAALIVLLDVPLWSEFDADGVTRVCALRRQRLPWSRVVALERLRGRPQVRGRDDGPRVRLHQGLAARTGPRRVSMLVDRRESRLEFDAIKALLRDRATTMRASPPPLEATPAGRGPRALHRSEQP